MLDLNSSFKCSDGTALKYRVFRGTKNKWIVFLHGYRVNSTVWTDYIAHFEKKGFSTLVFDLRGHGFSSRPKKLSKYRFSRYTKDLEEIINHEKLHKFALIGYSMGGTISLSYAASHPDKVKQLVLISTCSSIRKRIRKRSIVLFPLAMTMLDLLRAAYSMLYKNKNEKIDFSKLKDKDGIEMLFEASKDNDCRLNFAELASLIAFNSKKSAEKINVPTLILGGDDDELFSIDSFKKLQNEITGSELRIFGGTHCMVFVTPKPLISEMEKFLIL